jgi:hypothetical protein
VLHGFKKTDDKIIVVEIQERLLAVLKGAFATSPTPLKAIPKKREESRSEKGKKKR